MTLTALALAVLAQADAGEVLVDVQSAASPRVTIDGEAATDLLVANSLDRDPDPTVPAELTAMDLGLRARLYATAFSRHLHLDVDYQGRQPVAGNLQKTPLHLLHKAELSFDFNDGMFFVGVGRFVAPAAALLTVDGLRAQVRLGSVELEVFGGRRAISSTRDGNVILPTFLPAAGASVALGLPRVRVELVFAYAKDEVALAGDERIVGEVPEVDEKRTVDAASGSLRLSARPFDWLALGGALAIAQRARYELGPTWGDLSLRVASVDLFYGLAFVELRPSKTLRIGYDFHLQRAELFKEPSDADGAATVFTPNFVDNRVRLKWRPFDLGWVGPEVRVRVRPDRTELRFGGMLDLAPDQARGFCLRASGTYEKMIGATTEADRGFWSASLGYRRGGLDLQVGASDVQRSTLPLSSRVYTPYEDTPLAPVDLSPFVLQAQRLAFVRAFWGNDVWFAGLDFEQSLTDVRERRVFAQLGARLEAAW